MCIRDRDPYSGTYVAPEKAETEEDSGGIAIPGWGSIRIKAGEKLVDVNLENPADNKDCYNMSFTLYLKGETEPLAETGLIRPGAVSYTHLLQWKQAAENPESLENSSLSPLGEIYLKGSNFSRKKCRTRRELGKKRELEEN